MYPVAQYIINILQTEFQNKRKNICKVPNCVNIEDNEREPKGASTIHESQTNYLPYEDLFVPNR